MSAGTEPPAIDPAPEPATDTTRHDTTTSARTSGPVGTALALIAAGAVWLASLAGVAIPWRQALPVALIVIGVAVLATSRRASRGGLIGLGVAVAIVAVIATLAPGQPAISAGDRTIAPSAGGSLARDYRLGLGSLVVDLSDMELPEGTTTLEVSVLIGEVTVIVPEGVRVVGSARAAVGEVTAFGQTSEGLRPDVVLADGTGPRVLRLNVGAVVGSVEVTREEAPR